MWSKWSQKEEKSSKIFDILSESKVRNCVLDLGESEGKLVLVFKNEIKAQDLETWALNSDIDFQITTENLILTISEYWVL